MRMAFHIRNCVGTRDDRSFAVQWLACTLPCRRFAGVLTDVCARLGADADRYSFTVRDSHPLLLVGLPAHSANLHKNGSRVFTSCQTKSRPEAASQFKSMMWIRRPSMLALTSADTPGEGAKIG